MKYGIWIYAFEMNSFKKDLSNSCINFKLFYTHTEGNRCTLRVNVGECKVWTNAEY
jgi:hypothetical protein